MGILMLIGICVRVSDSNIEYRFMLVFPQSTEEDITSVSRQLGNERKARYRQKKTNAGDPIEELSTF
jgi:hypothetical protein